jgi:hypothetical protein
MKERKRKWRKMETKKIETEVSDRYRGSKSKSEHYSEIKYHLSRSFCIQTYL